MAAPTAAELTALAEQLREGLAKLAQTASGLDRHIAAEAKKIGDAFGRTYAKAADERIKDSAAEMRRQVDLVAELRRQMKPLERRSDKYFSIEKAIRAAQKDGANAIDIGYLLGIINAPARPDTKET